MKLSPKLIQTCIPRCIAIFNTKLSKKRSVAKAPPVNNSLFQTWPSGSVPIRSLEDDGYLFKDSGGLLKSLTCIPSELYPLGAVWKCIQIKRYIVKPPPGSRNNVFLVG